MLRITILAALLMTGCQDGTAQRRCAKEEARLLPIMSGKTVVMVPMRSCARWEATSHE